MDDYDFLYNDEITVLNLRKLYESKGYKKYKMSRFESYDFYAKNRDFLVSNKVLTFTDLNGKLMALKPDVTLSIAKNADPSKVQKFYYTENIYRESREIHEFKEIFQVGVEVLGKIDESDSFDVVTLALKSLLEIDKDAVLGISHTAYIEPLINDVSSDETVKKTVRSLLKSKNSHELLNLSKERGLNKDGADALIEILKSSGSRENALEVAKKYVIDDCMNASLIEIGELIKRLSEEGLSKNVKIDLSGVGDPNYYSGIIMKGFIHNAPVNVLSGGRYDALLKKMGKENAGAIGFAIYFDALDRILHKRESKIYD